MDKTQIDYFQSEMDYINQATRDFARTYPQHASQLNLDGGFDRDPTIERLLEGSAFLTAEIKSSIDAGVFELNKSVLQQIAPEACQVSPSKVIVEFNAINEQIQSAQTIAANTRLSSEPLGDEKTTCVFSTCADFNYLPLTINVIDVQQVSAHNTELRIKFSTVNEISLDQCDFDELTFYVNLEHTKACDLFHCLTNQVQSLRLSHDGKSTLLQGQVTIQHKHWLELQAKNQRALPLKSLLGDFFSFPEKFFFITLAGFNSKLLSTQSHEFELIIDLLDYPNSLLSLQASDLKLNCVPAINQFEQQCEPIRFDNKHAKYKLTVDKQRHESLQLIDIQACASIDNASFKHQTYHDFYDLCHLNQSAACYRLQSSKINDNTVCHYISFIATNSKPQTISVSALACNGYYPRSFMSLNSLHLADKNLPAYFTASNITRPSLFLLPSLHSNSIALQLLELSKLCDLRVFKNFLKNYDGVKKSSTMIEAIESLSMQTKHTFQQGVLQKMVTMTLAIDDSSFYSHAQAYCFSLMLHYLFDYYRPIGSKIITCVNLTKANKAWKHQ